MASLTHTTPHTAKKIKRKPRELATSYTYSPQNIPNKQAQPNARKWAELHDYDNERDKMAAISEAFSWMKSLYFDQTSLKFVHKSPIDNNRALF